MSELRLALRTLLGQPAYALAVCLTLGLAVGVNTGFFGVVNAVLLRPLAGVNAMGLVSVYLTREGRPEGFSGFSYPAFRDLQERTRSLGVEGFIGRGFAVGDGAASAVVGGQLVSGGFLRQLGTQASRGRLLGPEDDRKGAPLVAVLSTALWQRLGGREDLVGSTLRIGGHSATVVGIAEEGFRGHFLGFPMDLFMPLSAGPTLARDIDLEDHLAHDIEVLGRLRPGLALPAARAELAVRAEEFGRTWPETYRGRGIEAGAYDGLDADLRGPVLGFLALLATVGALVLLVACVNVAGLLLARGTARERELAVRAALGASSRDLARPLLAETLLLFGAASVLGVGLVGPSARVLHAFLPEFPIPLHLDARADWRVALFALGSTALVALLFGALPARAACRADVLELLKSGGRARALSNQAGRRAFVAAQVGLCLVLLVSASAFLRDLREARRFDPGFRTARLGVVSTDMRLLDRSPAAVQAFFTAWLERVRSRPDTEAAALAASLPLGLGRPLTRVQVDGVEPPGPEGFEAGWNRVSPGYFHALGIPLVSGRDFDQGDREGAEPVAIVSRSTAERLFAGQEPLGRGLRHQGQVLRVVGVVSDTAVERSGRRDHLFFYMPFAQGAPGRASLILRGPGPPRLEEARREALALEPDLPVIAARSFEEHAGAALFRQRLAASVTGAFGLLGLLLATVGLYGIVSYFALQRRRELAIRAALGARSVDLRRLVLAQGLGPLALGLVLGLSAALALSRVVAGVLPTVGAFDPVAFGIPAAVLGGAALLAADLPARRAAGRPPIVSLRAE